MNDTPTTYEDISFTILGNSFTLRCRKEQQADLKQAVLCIQEITSRILRDSPTLSPQQAAILAAIDSQSRLQHYMSGSTPFQDQASKTVQEIKTILLQTKAQVDPKHLA
ncbi:MAG: cell division protein ZapA [Candidatus Anaerobiospirillum merdipullorum]|uniref:Cell division protein ZapA n=1 Tax=Candidatus Anaerobiospirillum merdipullorum TaxID=2838450 RepID=A0A9E2KPN7_9GAMM|nr:cell division protein ZapA [Candidatus Anaerobiospirillum merdipullorum]